MSNILSIYGAHDASVTFIDKNGDIRVFEYERFVKKRYAAFSKKFNKDSDNDKNRIEFLTYIKNEISEEIDTILYNNIFDDDFILLKNFFPNSVFEEMGHHISHASSGFYLTNYKDAIILSIDGGGHDYGVVSFTNIFYGNEDEIKLLKTENFNLGVSYGRIGCPISEISDGGGDPTDSLAYAGKVMGLCAYGKVRQMWVQPFKEYYLGRENKYNRSNLNFLGRNIGLNLEYNKLSGQDSYDLASTSQYVFEEIMMELVTPYLDKSNNFIIVGGCGLNVLFNQKLKVFLNNMGKNLYVPPSPNDCGLSLGQFLHKTKKRIDEFVYNGIGILDYHKLDTYIETYGAIKINTFDIVDLIKNGKIIGLVHGNSEVGPRALGNRSIICDPTIGDMKDILNHKVKFREWFRPFAPVCREEDSNLFFEDVFPSNYMSYAPTIKEEYRNIIPSVTHNDGTGRLQTVNYEQHNIFYEILTELKNRDVPPIILNTSFNIKGKPILTTIEDSLYVLENTDLDCLVIEGFLFEKLKK